MLCNAEIFSVQPESSKDHYNTLTVGSEYDSIKKKLRFGVLTTTSPSFSGIISNRETSNPPPNFQSLISSKFSTKILTKNLSKTSINDAKIMSNTTLVTAADLEAA